MFSITLIDNIYRFLSGKYGTDLVAVYGIGSRFFSDQSKISDIDIVVILNDTSKCPKKDYTTSLFEDFTFIDEDKKVKVTFLYGTLSDYFSKVRFQIVSFADWSWSVRSLKFGSKLLWGKDIRDNLPMPSYDYGSIFLRSAYHLNYTSSRYTNDISLTKAIFKFTFFLVTVYYPEENEFHHEGIEKLINANKITLVFS